MSSVEELRARIEEVGRPTAIAEEMIRLGFLTEKQLKSLNIDSKLLQSTISELKPTLEQLRDAETKLASLDDTAALLKEIRSERIAMVKAKREERKAEKERMRAERQAAWELRNARKHRSLGPAYLPSWYSKVEIQRA